MNWLSALSDAQMNPEQHRAFMRARAKFGFDAENEAPTWLRVLANSPGFLKDACMNVERSIFEDGNLPGKSKCLLAAVAASHEGQTELAHYFASRAVAQGFTQEQLHDALGIAATGTSFNYYYKFRSMAGVQEFEGFNAGLRASLFIRSSLGKAMGELINLLVATANGCSSCVAGHLFEAARYDVTKAQIDETIRTGAIVASICSFLRSSSALRTGL
jgi:lipoyl-dependent peroxiredoxin subunit D